MLAKSFNNTRIKYVTFNDLLKIQFLQTKHPLSLKNSEIFVFIELAAVVSVLGASIIRCTMAEFIRAMIIHGVPHISASTVRRNLSRLETLGFCRRRHSQFGKENLGIEIQINIQAMRFWTKNVNKSPTSVYISLPQSNLEVSDRTKNTLHVNSRNNSNISKEQVKNKFKLWKHPILYTLICVLRRDPNRSALLNRADIEIRSKTAGIELVNHSGIDWAFHEKHWQEMPPTKGGPRENIAKNEIVPLLRRCFPKSREQQRTLHTEEPLYDLPPPSAEEIAQFRKNLKIPLHTNMIIRTQKDEKQEKFEGLDILIDARNRIKRHIDSS